MSDNRYYVKQSQRGAMSGRLCSPGWVFSGNILNLTVNVSLNPDAATRLARI